MIEYKALCFVILICIVFWLKPSTSCKKTKRRRPINKKNVTKKEQWALDTLAKYFKKHELNDWKYEISSKMTTTLGCTYHQTKTIRISKLHIKKHSKREIKDTILHEIAHALVGSDAHHNEIWKATAKKIGVKNLKASVDFK